MTKSPSAAGRSTPTRVPNRDRACCICSSTSSSVTSASATSTCKPSQSASVTDGRMSTSTVNQFLTVGEVGDVDLAGLVGAARRPRRPGRRARERLVDGLVQDCWPLDALVDDQRGDLSTTEPGHVHLRRNALIGGLDAGLELLERHLDREPNPGRVEGLTTLFTGESPEGCGKTHQSAPTLIVAAADEPGRRRLVGVPGFEPGPSAPKADALPNCAIPRWIPTS